MGVGVVYCCMGEVVVIGDAFRGEPGPMGAPWGVHTPPPLVADFTNFLYLLRRFWNQIFTCREKNEYILVCLVKKISIIL